MANPPQIAVRDFPSPEILDGLLVERIDNNKGAYAPVPVGTRYPEGSDSVYPGYELVHQKTSDDFAWTFRYWANIPRNQDLYNAAIEYDDHNPEYPIYTRAYVERRPYTVRARGLALQAVIGAVVTNGGSGYDVPPVVTLTGGAGTGATAEALIYRGSVVYVRITAEGTGYTSAPTVVFASGSAAATAYIQPASAVLTSEEVGKLPQEDPRFGLYDLVRRVYETLPGSITTTYKYDEDSDVFIETSKQKKLLSEITPSVEHDNDNSVTIVEEEPIDDLVGYEVVTVIRKSPHFDVDTAEIEYKVEPYQFPGYIDIVALDTYGTAIGYRGTNSQTVLKTFKKWWVIADEPPVPEFDEVIPGDIVINDVSYRDVLHDETTRTYNGIPVTVPATVPSFTEYYGTVADPAEPFDPGTGPKWIGTEKIIQTSVVRSLSEYRWEVTQQIVTMQ